MTARTGSEALAHAIEVLSAATAAPSPPALPPPRGAAASAAAGSSSQCWLQNDTGVPLQYVLTDGLQADSFPAAGASCR